MEKFVYAFEEGGRQLDALLGGKGAGLAEMTRMKLPVPPGFTITTQACRAYLEDGTEPDGLAEEVTHALAALTAKTRRVFGPDRPLLVAVRSGARTSMPGMMDTVLNVGLNDETVAQLVAWSGDEPFAWTSYSRFVRSFGQTVLGIDEALFVAAQAATGARFGGAPPDVAQLKALTWAYRSVVAEQTGEDLPQDRRVQLDLAVEAVFRSWNGERARVYRQRGHIPDGLGTAVNVCLMIFGNLGADSGTGVAFTRDPATGAPGTYGDYLPHAVGEDIVAGLSNTVPLRDLERSNPAAYSDLCDHLRMLETHYRDMCDVEFTVEHSKLWMLQTRIGERSAEATFRVAADLVAEGVITKDEALLRTSGERLARLLFPRFDERDSPEPLAVGVAASPGAAVGRVVFDAHTAAERKAAGQDVILVRPQTRPEDLPGMLAAAGILTSQGGKTSHAAVVARGLGRPCVCGADQIEVDVASGCFTAGDGTVVKDGDFISLDGTTGAVHLGRIPVVASTVVRYLQRDRGSRSPEQDQGPVASAVEQILGWADDRRRLGVEANADTAADAEQARRFGAEGIGLCRTEHMFLGERRPLLERMILADTGQERASALAELGRLQRADFLQILRVMDGLPVTVRLLDPPLHEFLPDLTELAVRVATSAPDDPEYKSGQDLLAAVRRMHEENPMLGLRGVRLGLVVPGLYAMQVRALAEAAAELERDGLDPRPRLMVPLVGDVRELSLVRLAAEQVLTEVAAVTGSTVDCPIGTMIELPRAALSAAELAGAADFFSFGTNDLTQTTWGLSRDDVEATIVPVYQAHAIFETSPFQTIDPVVGRLVATATDAGRRAHHGLDSGVCGEHGGDPASIAFFDGAGLDYVSCSPFRVPVARLEAARAAVLATVSPISGHTDGDFA